MEDVSALHPWHCHIGSGVFGGPVLFVATALVASTGNIYAGLVYPITVALITLVIGGYYIKEDKQRICMQMEY